MLSADRITYGIHSLAPYQRSDGLPFGILKVLGGGSISLAAEFEDLFGGSNKFQWASEPKTISSEFTAIVKSMPDFLFEVYLGATVSTTAADSGGTASAIVNKLNASVVASTGVTSVITIDTAVDLKSGIYVIKVVSATTVDIFSLTDIDFARGANLAYDDDLLKITATPLTVVQGAPVAIPGLGVSLNGDSGAIAMVTGDTAIFNLAKPHNGISEITIGSTGTTFPAHGLIALAAPRADGSQFEIEIFNAIGAGFPIGLEETVFAIPELTVKLLYDAAENAVARIRAIAGPV